MIEALSFSELPDVRAQVRAGQGVALCGNLQPRPDAEQVPAGLDQPHAEGADMNLLGIGAGTVAALFVQADGCYVGLPGVDAWPEHRDARLYAGPYPVVAHPPCQRWGAMADVNYARWGGDHNRPGNDGGCFAAALESVRRFGGVLEHPAKTKAWAAHGLTRPAAIGWQRTIDDGWVCEVWQSAYGHRANKATWLYYVGERPPFQLRWERPVGTHQIGFQDQRGKAANKPTLGKKEANATPLEFRDELLRLAMKAHNTQ